jgi:hypothetical protein
MSKPLPKELIKKIQEEILNGKNKYQVAEEHGIAKSKVYQITKDISSRPKYLLLSKETIKQIRDEILKGKSKYQVALEMNIRLGAVYYNTKDLPSHTYKEYGIQGKSIDLLYQLINQGYVESTQYTHIRMRKLKKYLPMIQRAQIDGKSIYYLQEKSKEALKAMVARDTSRIINYKDLSKLTRVFDIKLSKGEKNDLMRNRDAHNTPVIRKKDGGYLSSYRKNQTKLEDFHT